MYGKFDGFPLKMCIVWAGNIMTPVGCAWRGAMNIHLFMPIKSCTGRNVIEIKESDPG